MSSHLAKKIKDEFYLLFVLVLSKEKVICERSEVRIIMNHLGLTISVMDIAQRFLRCLLSLYFSKLLLNLSRYNLFFFLPWPIEEALIEISLLIALVR